MEHAPDDLKELLRQKFIEFHEGKQGNLHNHGEGCGCGSSRKKSLSDFIK
jgi:hypothetical protein